MDKATKAGLVELAARIGWQPHYHANKAYIIEGIFTRIDEMKAAIAEHAQQMQNLNATNMTLTHLNGVLQQRVHDLETAPTLGVWGCWVVRAFAGF